MIARPHYIDRLRSLKDLRIIKTLSGVRRSGKSTILELFKDHLLSSGVEAERIQMINFEDLANATLL
ncbi:MAG: ATP-binding protein, partial [Spirochaetales bacterium]|nr:ATP-binding protein [Spirochaetales bacterium]